MEHLADAPSLAQHLHGDGVHEEGPVVGDDLDHSRAACCPAVIVLAGRPDGDDRASGRPVHCCSVVTLDQAEEVLDAALVDVECVDMPEVVIEEDLDSVRILTQLRGDLRPASGYLSDLLGLLLLELDLESSHVYRPIIAAAPRCAATSDISPHGALPVVPPGDRRSGDIMSVMDISSHLDFAATPAEVYAMMTDQKYLEEVCVASESLSHHVSVDGSTTRTSRTLPAPDSAARFTGPQLTVNDEVVWADPASDDSRSAAVTMNVLGQPVNFRGKLEVSRGGRGSVVDVSGVLKVAIPLLGRKLEEAAAPAVMAGYRTQQEVGDRWLARSSSPRESEEA